MIMTRRIHAVIYREVPTDEIRAHRCVLARETFIVINRVRLVFSVIDADDARVSRYLGSREDCCCPGW